jgi:hypothetical protein
MLVPHSTTAPKSNRIFENTVFPALRVAARFHYRDNPLKGDPLPLPSLTCFGVKRQRSSHRDFRKLENSQ